MKPWVPGSLAAQQQSKVGTWDEEERRKVERYEPLNQAAGGTAQQPSGGPVTEVSQLRMPHADVQSASRGVACHTTSRPKHRVWGCEEHSEMKDTSGPHAENPSSQAR